MRKKLVNLYFSQEHGILLVGCKTFTAAYETCGVPKILPFTVSEQDLGTQVFDELLRIDQYTESDIDHDFWKKIRGMRSYSKFMKIMDLILVWWDGNTFLLKGNKRLGKYYMALSERLVKLSANITPEQLGHHLKAMMIQKDEPGCPSDT